ncbi:MAG: LPS assembly lipoprotein LptE [Arsenophonus sp. NC-WZS1-MAG3]
MRYLIRLFLYLAVLITASCKFCLQSMPKITEELKTLKLSSADPYGPLERAIRQQLRLNNINLIDENLQNVPILKIVDSYENIKTVSIYQDGKSIEKQLNFWVSAQIILSNGTVYPIKIHVKRAFFENPLEILAKDAENELIKQEMREQVARQLIRKLLIMHITIHNEPKGSVIAEKAL